MRLEGKVAVVTGAASGFGAEMARRFAAEGARVVVADLDGPGAERVAAELGEAGVNVQGDVSSRGDTATMIQAARNRFGRIDILVNNAGCTHINQPMLDVDEETFDRVFAVNVKSIYLTALAAVPAFREQGGGVILNVASTAGLRPRPGLTWYNGSKGAVVLLSKSMAVELAPDAIRVNALCPVLSETPPDVTVHGRRYAGAPGCIPGERSPGPVRRVFGRGIGGGLPCFRRGRVHHRGGAGN